MQIDPLVRVDAQFLRHFNRHDQHSRGLIDLVARDQQAGVGICDHAIALARSDQCFSGVCDGRSRIRILRRDRAERREQAPHLARVVLS